MNSQIEAIMGKGEKKGKSAKNYLSIGLFAQKYNENGNVARKKKITTYSTLSLLHTHTHTHLKKSI